MLEDTSDTNVGEKEATQPSKSNANINYVNTFMIEDEVKEPEMYEEASQNTALQ